MEKKQKKNIRKLVVREDRNNFPGSKRRHEIEEIRGKRNISVWEEKGVDLQKGDSIEIAHIVKVVLTPTGLNKNTKTINIGPIFAVLDLQLSNRSENQLTYTLFQTYTPFHNARKQRVL